VKNGHPEQGRPFLRLPHNFKHMSQEYIAALAIVIVGALKAFKVEIATDQITAIITTVLGLWVMYRRYSQGNITVTGVRL